MDTWTSVSLLECFINGGVRTKRTLVLDTSTNVGLVNVRGGLTIDPDPLYMMPVNGLSSGVLMSVDSEKSRLFRLSPYRYVLCEAGEEISAELQDYQSRNSGELPPYFFLPKGPVKFQVYSRATVRWTGKGPLPDEVMEYVQENGVLPDYTPRDGEDREAE